MVYELRISDWSSDVCSSELFQYGQHTVVLETGEIARQASGAVLVSIEDTVVLATVVASKKAKPGQDFFPLTVDYVEKTYAAGRIPGGFFKREGKPSEKETLTSRLIDRPLRPLFRSEEHTSELQSLMRISYAVFCLKKKKHTTYNVNHP